VIKLFKRYYTQAQIDKMERDAQDRNANAQVTQDEESITVKGLSLEGVKIFLYNATILQDRNNRNRRAGR
jgi:hypothetical protein